MYNDVYVKTLQKGRDGATWYNGTVSGAISGSSNYQTATGIDGNTITPVKGDLLFEKNMNKFYVWDGSKWVYLSTVEIPDPTLTVTDKAADAKMTGDRIVETLKFLDSVDSNGLHQYGKGDWELGSINKYGNDLNAANPICRTAPELVTPGSVITYSGAIKDNDNVNLTIIYAVFYSGIPASSDTVVSAGQSESDVRYNFRTDASVTVPAGARYVRFALGYNSSTTPQTDITPTAAKNYFKATSKTVLNDVRFTKKNVEFGTSANDIIDDGVYFSSHSSSGDTITDLPYPGEAGWLEVTSSTHSSNIKLQIFYPTKSSLVPMKRNRMSSGDWATSWSTFYKVDRSLTESGEAADAKVVGDALREGCRRSLKILVFGSSFAYSILGYLPAVMEDFAPDIDFTMGIVYSSGSTIGNHSTKFSGNTAEDRYNEYTSATGSWTNSTSNTVTGKNALDKHQWDYIVLQDVATVRQSTGIKSADEIKTFIDLVSDYLDYPVCFLLAMPQSHGAGSTSWNSYFSRFTDGEAKSDAQYEDIAQYCVNAMNKTPVLDVLPCGTAVQNARQLDIFKAIGDDDFGYLAHDETSHLKNGSGPLIAAYAACLKICELIGHKQKVFSGNLTPTDEWLDAYNLWTKTSHGECDEVTEEKKLYAAKCAMMAYRRPFEITNINTGLAPNIFEVSLTSGESEGVTTYITNRTAIELYDAINSSKLLKISVTISDDNTQEYLTACNCQRSIDDGNASYNFWFIDSDGNKYISPDLADTDNVVFLIDET